ncbi:unnamed protein product, partial [Cuscuta campestris]
QEDFNRIRAIRSVLEMDTLHDSIVAKLRGMLDEHNVLVKSFRM